VAGEGGTEHSGTPLPRKLGIRPGARPLTRLATDLDVIVLAVDRLADLRRRPWCGCGTARERGGSGFPA
jgi:hypothetical protein